MTAKINKKLTWGVYLGIVLALIIAPMAMAEVWTNKDVYSPGELVTIEGDGMWPGEDVQVEVFFPDGSLAQSNVVTADDEGNFIDYYELPPPEDPVEGYYTVVATGLESTNVFNTTFFDPVTVANITIKDSDCNLAKTTFTLGEEVCASIDFTVSTGAAGNTYRVRWFAPGEYPSGTPSRDISFPKSPPASGTDTDKFTPTSTGTWTIQTCREQSPSCSAHELDAKEFTVSSAATAPSVTPPANQTTNEGTSTSFDLGSFSDPDGGPWSVAVNWGDGSTDTTFNVSSAGSLGAQDHTYADNGTYTVTVTVTDSTSLSDSKTFQVTVANVAPTVTPPADQSADEGASTSFNLGSFSDPGVVDYPWDVEVDWGDSSTDNFSTGIQGSLGSMNHTYADNGVYTVTVTVTDKDGGVGSATFEVTVANVAPTVTPPADQSADEGENKAFDLGSFSDPGVDDDPWTMDVDWDDGSTDSFNTNTQGSLGSLNHTYADNGTYTVTVTVTDKDGDSGSATFEVTVANVAPTVTEPASQSADEGEDKAFDLGSFSDPGVDDDPWTVDVDWDDGSTDSFNTNTQGSLGSLNHTYADNGTYTVTVTVTDKDGDSGSATFEVTVANVAPTVTEPSDQTAILNGDTSFNLGTFSDPGVNDDPWDVEVDWGDGNTDSFSTNTQGSLGSLNHTYTSVGIKTVTVTVTDKDGDSGSAQFQVNVQYLPAGTMCLGAPGHQILPPIKADGTSVFKRNSTVPAKFRVCDALGNSIGLPGVVQTFRLVGITTGTVTAPVDDTVSSTTPDTEFRWDPTEQQWIFNIYTKNLTANKTYHYRISLNDGTIIEFSFGIR